MSEMYIPYLETEIRPVTLKVPKEKEIVALVFSKDRPLQLDLCLSSLRLCCKDISLLQEVVIYKASNEDFKKAYESVIEEHPWTNFVEETVFKQNLLDSLRDKRFVLFCVDDTIFCQNFYVFDLIQTLNSNFAIIGFSLRLGCNTTYCYSLNVNQKVPSFKYMRYENLSSDIVFWEWQKPKAEADFGYPLELSSSCYRVQDLYEILKFIEFENPNQLESYLDAVSIHFVHQKPFLACFLESKTFANPQNKVQKTAPLNRSWVEEKYSANNLLKEYQNNRRIDPKKFLNFKSNAAHEIVDLF
jgi:hypothetical protein